jgi:ribosomal protein S18 acetylase RimI-like enzyme
MQSLRDTRPEDAEAIARLHVEIWRTTYRPFVPQAVYDRLDVPARVIQWQELLAPADDGRGTLLAEVDGVLAAFSYYGPPGDPVFGDLGELKKLYVAETFARRGLGRLLLLASAKRLRDQGYPGVGVGVLAENLPARAFYEAQGGKLIASYVDPGPNWRSDNVVYAWHDFAAFGSLS